MSDHSFRSKQAELDWSERELPRSSRFDDVYYAREDARGESEHVFIKGSRLFERWSQAPAGSHCFVIAETGFGAALNFLQCWQLWREHPDKHPDWKRLHYLAMEQFPLSRDDLSRLHQLWPDLEQYALGLQQWYRPDCSGWQRILLSTDVCLDLIIGDAGTELDKRAHTDQPVDAWLLDGFSPDKNPELWSDQLFDLLARHSHQNSSVATYSCAGHVRRGLQKAGFAVSKISGFANKRHMLCGQQFSPRNSEPAPVNKVQPWFELNSSHHRNREAVIVGAGLAGCHTAWSLASRGWRVRLLDAGNCLGRGASGIPQLALRCRLFSQHDWAASFYLQAFCFASRFFQSLQHRSDCGWHGSGVLQLADAMNKRKSLDPDVMASLYPESVLQIGNLPQSLQALASENSCWFVEGGWVDPARLCNSLLTAAGTEVRYGQSVQQLQRDGEQWLLLGEQDRVLDAAEVVVLACGAHTARFSQTAPLHYELTSGQCTLLQTSKTLNGIDPVLAGSRTVFPASNNVHTVAASYRPTTEPVDADPDCDRENLAALADMLGIEAEDFQQTGSAVALRANTRDRLPCIGRVPVFATMKEQYAALSLNANQRFAEPGKYHQGLYLSSGHGSNGLSSSPLAGEILASMINGDSLPVPRQIMDTINPCRFLIQDLKKQRS